MKYFFLFLLSLLFVFTSFSQEAEQIGTEVYPTGINPLTGLPLANPANLQRRPLIIKVSNYPDFIRQRQWGLSQADIVWESLLAGGVTRFSAIFYGNDAERVGPIRSARLVDFELVRVYKALFTYSGMAQGALDVLNNDSLLLSRAVGGSGPEPALFRVPEEGLAQEHTLFGNTSEIRHLASENHRDTNPESIYGMAFSPYPSSAGLAIDSLLLRYSQTLVTWQWDNETHRWLRWTDSLPHILADTGQQLSATNILIIEAEHEIQPIVSEAYWGPPNFAYDVHFIGEGRVFLLRDGIMIEGIWRRSSEAEPLRYYDLAGHDLAFAPGNSYINLVPLWIDGYELEFRATNAPIATVNVGEGVGTNLRYGPSAAYLSPDVSYTGDSFRLLGRNWDGTWLQVLHPFASRAFWLPTDELLLPEDFEVMSLPLVRPSNERGGS